MSTRTKRFLTLCMTLCLCLSLLSLSPVRASAAAELDRTTVTLNFEPVALMELQYVSVAVSRPNCHLVSATWYDAKGTPVGKQFGTGTYKLEVKVGADTGYIFAAGAKGYINNSDAGVTVSRSADGSTLTLTKSYNAAVWAPTVVKSPTGETRNEGEWASFAVSGTYVGSYEWYLESPDGSSKITMNDLAKQFPAVTADGDGTTKLNLYNLSAAMDGWKVFCRLWSVDKVSYKDSNRAVITVNSTAPATPEPTEAPVPEETAAPEETSAPEETAEPAEDPDASPAPGEGEETEEEPEEEYIPPHNFAAEWSWDENRHWHKCLDEGCTEVSDRFAHRFEWTVDEQSGEETGVCSTCGYTVTREKEQSVEEAAARDLNTFRYVLFGLMGLLGLSILILIGQSIRAARRRHSRRR